MKTLPILQLFAASIGLLPLGGCLTASSVTKDVREQEQTSRKELENEQRETVQLLRDRQRLESDLANSKRQRDEVRSALSETANAAERSVLQKKEESLNREISKLQDQLSQFSRN